MNNLNIKFAGKILGISIFLFSGVSFGGFGKIFPTRSPVQKNLETSGQVIKKFWGFEKKFARAYEQFLDCDPEITQNLIREYIELVDVMLTRFSPDKYIYIGLGGSPTFIMAILENLGDRVVTLDLPLSIMNEEHAIELNSNMGNYLNNCFSQTTDDSRNYVLIDFAFTGKSLEKAHALLVNYCKKIGLEKNVEPFALRQNHELFPPRFLCEHVKMPRILTHHVREEYAKVYRKYPPVKLDEINNSIVVLKVRSEYKNLLNFFGYLRQDERTPMSKL